MDKVNESEYRIPVRNETWYAKLLLCACLFVMGLGLFLAALAIVGPDDLESSRIALHRIFVPGLFAGLLAKAMPTQPANRRMTRRELRRLRKELAGVPEFLPLPKR